MRTITARLTQLARTTPLARLSEDEGMVTAEYAVGTVAACGFGGVLYTLLQSETVIGQLTDLIGRALASIFG